MKKRLLILPLLAFTAGALAGCNDAKDEKPHSTPTPVPGPNQDQTPAPIDYDCKLPPEDCFGHKRLVAAPEDGKEYYFGIYKKSSSKYMFINGEPHSDSKGEYPFYMSESEVSKEADFANMAKVKVSYVSGSDSKFNLQVIKSGAKNDLMYISIYEADSSYGNIVMSINAQATTVGEKFEGKDCYYDFEWITQVDGYNLNTIAIKTTDARVQETEPTPKFFGTADKYISMDCSHIDKMLGEDYNVAYLYEADVAQVEE